MYDIKTQRGMICVQENEVNKIHKCNLLNYLLNHSKDTKFLYSHYYSIIYVCMNTQNDRVKVKKI